MHRWATVFSNTANFVSFNSHEREIGKKSRGVIHSTNHVKRGKVFDYPGMDLDFESCPGTMTMIISMIKYLDTMFEEWPKELKGYKPSPHQDHLFEVRADDDLKKDLLNEEVASQFHHTISQLMFLCLRARPAI